MATEAYLYEAIRTPRGRGKKTGSLHSVEVPELLRVAAEAGASYH